jgi:hypothetical protein
MGWAQRWHRSGAGEVSLAIMTTRSFIILGKRLSAARRAKGETGELRGVQIRSAISQRRDEQINLWQADHGAVRPNGIYIKRAASLAASAIRWCEKPL